MQTNSTTEKTRKQAKQAQTQHKQRDKVKSWKRVDKRSQTV